MLAIVAMLVILYLGVGAGFLYHAFLGRYLEPRLDTNCMPKEVDMGGDSDWEEFITFSWAIPLAWIVWPSFIPYVLKHNDTIRKKNAEMIKKYKVSHK